MARRTPASPDDDPRAAGGARRGMGRLAVALWVIVVIALIAVIVVLHVSGAIGPGSH